MNEEKPTNLYYQQLEEESYKPFEGTEEIIKRKAERQDELFKKLYPDAYYLKEISKTLKEILREMRKRK